MLTMSVMTCDRKPSYLDRLVKSLLSSDDEIAGILPIFLVVGSPDSEYLRRWLKPGWFEAFELTPSEWQEMMKSNALLLKITYNFLRCLAVPRDPSKDVLVVEDDVIFAKDWLKTLRRILKRVYAKVGDRFVLSLYSSYDFRTLCKEEYFVVPQALKIGFYGAQAVLYSATIRPSLMSYIEEHCVKTSSITHDLAIRDYCLLNDIPLIHATRSLVQHIGKKSTGATFLAKDFHQSPTFVP